MFRNIRIWLGFIPDPRPVELSPKSQDLIARLDEMHDDIRRLSSEQWHAKWRPDNSRP